MFSRSFIVFFLVSSFNVAFAATTDVPMHFKSFVAEDYYDLVVLQWEVESEVNNEFYTIERSVQGGKFESVGTVKSTGDIDRKSPYSFKDQSSFNGNIIYRIKQTALDGAHSYSNVVFVTRSSDLSNVKIKNFGYYIEVESAAKDISLDVLDQAGQVLGQYVSSESKTISMEAFEAGVYFLRVNTNGECKTKRLLVW